MVSLMASLSSGKHQSCSVALCEPQQVRKSIVEIAKRKFHLRLAISASIKGVRSIWGLADSINAFDSSRLRAQLIWFDWLRVQRSPLAARTRSVAWKGANVCYVPAPMRQIPHSTERMQANASVRVAGRQSSIASSLIDCVIWWRLRLHNSRARAIECVQIAAQTSFFSWMAINQDIKLCVFFNWISGKIQLTCCCY